MTLPKRRYTRRKKQTEETEEHIVKDVKVEPQKLDRVSSTVLKIYIGRVRINFETCDNVEYL
jgi:hypothetical protein